MGSRRERALVVVGCTLVALAIGGTARAQQSGTPAPTAEPAVDAPGTDAPPAAGATPPEARPHELVVVEAEPAGATGPANVAPAEEDEPVCCTTSHVRRWFVHVLGGVAGQEDTGLVGGSVHVDIGTHPFFGAFGTGIGGGAEFMGLPLIAAHFGIFAQLDLAYLMASAFWPASLEHELPISLAVGARLGLAYGRSQRSVAWVPDDFVFELWRPEWRLYLDLEVPVATIGDARLRLVGRLIALDTSIDFSELSRWTVQVGVAFEWVRDPMLAGGDVE